MENGFVNNLGTVLDDAHVQSENYPVTESPADTTVMTSQTPPTTPPTTEITQELVDKAKEVIRQTRRVATATHKRRLKISFGTACKLLDTLESQGLIGPKTPEGRSINFDLPPVSEEPQSEPAKDVKEKKLPDYVPYRGLGQAETFTRAEFDITVGTSIKPGDMPVTKEVKDENTNAMKEIVNPYCIRMSESNLNGGDLQLVKRTGVEYADVVDRTGAVLAKIHITVYSRDSAGHLHHMDRLPKFGEAMYMLSYWLPKDSSSLTTNTLWDLIGVVKFVLAHSQTVQERFRRREFNKFRVHTVSREFSQLEASDWFDASFIDKKVEGGFRLDKKAKSSIAYLYNNGQEIGQLEIRSRGMVTYSWWSPVVDDEKNGPYKTLYMTRLAGEIIASCI